MKTMKLKCRPKRICLLTVNGWQVCMNLHKNQIWTYIKDKDNMYHIDYKFVSLVMNQNEFDKYFEGV